MSIYLVGAILCETTSTEHLLPTVSLALLRAAQSGSRTYLIKLVAFKSSLSCGFVYVMKECEYSRHTLGGVSVAEESGIYDFQSSVG